ncbi:hypothetical protein [Moorena bouillonii]|uniref:hypothetical protein n=1 Tax=Moorena bouillonii TaxID=207920 RepID=UPI00117F73FC|nr:hypothetical protein [Moorena bouillonii]NEO42881.1 hypothetical protein [Moorena sp. SIO4A3]
MQKYFSDSVYVNSCPLFPVPCSLFPTSARSLVNGIGLGAMALARGKRQKLTTGALSGSGLTQNWALNATSSRLL